MYGTCLFCTQRLGTNEVVEFFPVGQRLAFDASRGRLWVVCRRCERWNLTPIEERWEAIEECERLFADARKRVSTDNIGLARLDEGLELVRIGEPLRGEFAAWRYGDQFGRRHKRALATGSALAVAGAAAAVGALLLSATVGGGYWAYLAGENYAKRKNARKLIARVPTDDGEELTVLGEHLSAVRLAPEIGNEKVLGWKIEVPHIEGSRYLTGECASHAASLLMPTINKAGGTRSSVDRAVRRLENFDDPATYMLSAAAESIHSSRPGGAVIKLPGDIRLAIEMAVNEQAERHAFEGDMWLLEHAWKQAEEIASIADDLTTPAEIDFELMDLQRRNRGDNQP